MRNKEYKKLHAEWYNLVSSKIDHSREIDFWEQSIKMAGEPVLELGSGTGRVFVPLLERGIDIVGIDTSIEMMEQCRAACRLKGLNPKLYEQSMLTLDLPHKFNLVILDSGGLGLFTSDEDIQALFERVMTHLKPVGLFIYEYQPVPDEDKTSNDSYWVGDWIRGPDDVVIAWRNRWKHDSAKHTWETLFVVEKYVGGRLVETEANERLGRIFTNDEAIQFAEAAGFVEIRVNDWLTTEPPGKESKVVTVQCKKPVG